MGNSGFPPLRCTHRAVARTGQSGSCVNRQGNRMRFDNAPARSENRRLKPHRRGPLSDGFVAKRKERPPVLQMKEERRQQELRRWPERHRENPGDRGGSWRPLYARGTRRVKPHTTRFGRMARIVDPACAPSFFENWLHKPGFERARLTGVPGDRASSLG